MDCFEDGLDSTVGVGSYGVGVVAENVLNVIIGVLVVFKEVPVLGWTELVHELPLLHMLVSYLLVLFSFFAAVGFLPGDSLFLVVFDEVAKLVSLELISLETLQQNKVLDILAHMLVDVFKRLHSLEPGVLLLWIVVTLPHPGSTPLQAILPISLFLHLVM